VRPTEGCVESRKGKYAKTKRNAKGERKELGEMY
jgi:hypothetical protein